MNETIKERPILFSAPMVRALLDGRKTQTRRLVKPQPANLTAEMERVLPEAWACGFVGVKCPYGALGDRLYVRETWKPHSTFAGMKPRDIPRTHVFYKADEAYAPSNTPWVPAIHQPRWASRLTLEVTEVRVERLRDISTADILAEGAPVDPDHQDGTQDGSNPVMCLGENAWTTQSPLAWWHRLWASINGEESWTANPWVWAVSFKVVSR